MATINSNGTGGGNWATGASWNGGSSPGAADDAVILNGDTITKDTAEGAPDCATVTVNSGGTLAIGSNGVKTSGLFTNNGTVTGGANGSLFAAGNFSSAGHMILTGTAGNNFTLKGGSGTCFVSGARGASTRSTKMDFVTISLFERLHPRYFTWADYFNECTFIMDAGGQGLWPSDTWSTIALVLRRCVLNSASAGSGNAIRGLGYGSVYLYDCEIGTTTTFASIFLIDVPSPVIMLNCSWNATAFFWTPSTSLNQIVSSVGNQGVQGDWAIYSTAGVAAKSAAAKNVGTYGISVVPYSSCGSLQPVFFDILIPIISGQSVTPSLTYKNVTADLDLEAAAGRFVVVCDPGNEWGLYESVDVNGAADSFNNWRTISFTGGSAGGTAKSGFLRLQVFLARYVATGVVYVADVSDGTTTSDPTKGDLQGGFSDAAAGGGGGLLTNPGMSGGIRG